MVGINWSVTAATLSSHNSLVSAESRPALWFNMGLSREQVEQHIAGVQKRLGSETEVGYYLASRTRASSISICVGAHCS